jgi:hypothetical protein
MADEPVSHSCDICRQAKAPGMDAVCQPCKVEFLHDVRRALDHGISFPESEQVRVTGVERVESGCYTKMELFLGKRVVHLRVVRDDDA